MEKNIKLSAKQVKKVAKKALTGLLAGVFLLAPNLNEVNSSGFTSTISWAQGERLSSARTEGIVSSSSLVKNNKLAPKLNTTRAEFKEFYKAAATCRLIEKGGNLNNESSLRHIKDKLDAVKGSFENINFTVLPDEITIEIPDEGLAVRYFDPTKANVITPYSDIARLKTTIIGPRLNRQVIHRIKALSASDNQSYVAIKKLDRGENLEGIKVSLLEAFKMLGGAEAMFRGKDTVLIKPSLATKKNAEDGTTVNPLVIEAVVLILKELGVRRIIIGEGCVSEYNMEEIFKITGVCEIAKRHNVELINLNKAETIDIEVPRWQVWAKVKVSRVAAEADLIINIPRLTTHNQTVMSVATKNMKGVLPPPTKTFFHRGIDSEEKGIPHLAKAIVELNKALSRQIVIVDTTRSMEGDGPTRGESLNLHRIIVGRHPITVDRVCARIIGQPENNIDFLRFAQEQDFGPDPVILGDEVKDVVSEIGRPFKEPPVTPVTNPRITVYGDTTEVCSKCNGSLGSAAKILGSKKWENMLETNDIYLDIYMGSELPKKIEGNHYAVLMGRCPTQKAKKDGISHPNIIRVIGCAPRTADVLNPIEAKVKFKEFNDEIQRLVEDLRVKKYAVPKLVIFERKLPGNEISQVIKKESEITVIFDIEKLVYRKDFVFEDFIKIYWDVIGDIYSEDIKKVYEQIANGTDLNDSQFTEYMEIFKRDFIDQCDIKATDTVLDMGTGAGWMALLAADEAKEAIGMDICPAVIKLAIKNASLKGINNAKFLVGDATRCQFKNESFNVIISQYMFSRLPKELRRRTLREAHRMLTEKGLLRLWVYHPHVVPFAWNQDEWKKELEATGFEIESIEVKGEVALDTFEPQAMFIKTKKADLTARSDPAETSKKHMIDLAEIAKEQNREAGDEQTVIQADEKKVRIVSNSGASLYFGYATKNKDLFFDILGTEKPSMLLRVPIEAIEFVGTANIKDFLATFQEAPNAYVELYYMSGTGKVPESLYQKYGLQKKSLPTGFKRTRENTVTLFPVFKGENIDQSAIASRLGSIDITPQNTILSPIGLQRDPAGLIRATILGLKMMDVARQIREKGIDVTKDTAFKDKIQLEILEELKNVCDAEDLKNFNLTPDDIIALATGTINNIITALKKLIKLLPITPIDTEELRHIYEHAKTVITAA